MNKYIRLIFAALFVVSLASCLKDKDYDNNITGHNLSGANKIIEIGYINEPGHEKSAALDFKDEPVNVTLFFVRLAANEVAQEDITVTLDTTGAAAKVAAAGKVILPTTFYTAPTIKVVIPKGSRESAPFAITTNASRFDPSTTYGLYYRIVAVDKPGYTISGNYGEFINTFSAKNSYDGVYTVVSGVVTRYTNPTTPANDALSGSLAGNPDVRLITTGANSVNIPPPGQAGALFWAFVSGSQVAGIDGTRITVDPVTKLVTMSSAGNATLTNRPGGENRYDPATKTFYLDFHWNPAANKREYRVVLRYKGPR